MKRFFSLIVAGIFAAVAFSAVAAPAYPTTNPTYVPTAAGPQTNYTAPGDYVFQTHDIAVSSLRVTGTCTSLAGTLQGTNDGTNWTNLVLSAVGPTASSTVNVGATGFWTANTGGFTQARFHITALTASCNVQMAGTMTGRVIADPCGDPSIMKSSAVLNVGASTTASIVAASTGASVYVCGFTASLAGTTPTVLFEYGTTTTTPCDTGATGLTGTFAPTAGSVLEYGPGVATAFSTPVSKQLCVVTGATSSLQGVLTYVQQ